MSSSPEVVCSSRFSLCPEEELRLNLNEVTMMYMKDENESIQTKVNLFLFDL
jgi:hypothetical protein